MWGKGWGADTKGGRRSRPGLGLWPQTALPFGWLLRLYGCSSPLSLAQTVIWYCKLLFGKERKQILQMKKKAEMSCSFQTFVLCRIGGLVLSGCMPPTGVLLCFYICFSECVSRLWLLGSSAALLALGYSFGRYRPVWTAGVLLVLAVVCF